MITLHVFPPSPRSFKVLAGADHLGIDCDIRIVDLTKGEQRTPQFLALNPNARVPVLEEDGFALWESNAILQYLADIEGDGALLPNDARGRADVTRWQCWDMGHWDPACATLIFERVVKQIFGGGDPDAGECARGEERFHRCAAVLDRHLGGHRFITGEALTVADFSIGAPLNLALPARLPLDAYPEIVRWHAELAELPAWRNHRAALPVASRTTAADQAA
jgi:glutathione S-transferase